MTWYASGACDFIIDQTIFASWLTSKSQSTGESTEARHIGRWMREKLPAAVRSFGIQLKNRTGWLFATRFTTNSFRCGPTQATLTRRSRLRTWFESRPPSRSENKKCNFTTKTQIIIITIIIPHIANQMPIDFEWIISKIHQNFNNQSASFIIW